MLNNLLTKLISFRNRRDWKQFHTPLNLAVSLQLEVSEILEHFQWMTNEEFMIKFKSDSKKKQAVKEEIADAFSYLLLLADSLNLDLKKELENKIKKNSLKYPISKSKGNAKKYTELS